MDTWIDENLLVRVGTRDLHLPPFDGSDVGLVEVKAMLDARNGLRDTVQAFGKKLSEIAKTRMLTDYEKSALRHAAGKKARDEIAGFAATVTKVRDEVIPVRESKLVPAAPALRDGDVAGQLLDATLLQRVEQWDGGRRAVLVSQIRQGEPSAVRAGEALLRMRSLANVPGEFVRELEGELFQWRNAEVINQIKQASAAVSSVGRVVETALQIVGSEVARDQQAVAA